MNTSSIVRILSDAFGNQIYIKREDLLPFSFGGNKVRIAQEFLLDMKRKGGNCMIGYGNARSNLSRALANMCYAEGIPCHIISPADDDGTRIETANSRIVKACGVTFHECAKQNVAETVTSVIDMCKEQGLSPYYIYGDRFGKGNEAVPVRAYAKVYKEIRRQSQEMQVQYDYIFLATGTGMTQAGLLAGQGQLGGTEAIVGISVARDAQNEIPVIDGFLKAYAVDNGIDRMEHSSITVTDEYLCGGYGEYNEAIKRTILDVFCHTGIPLDPTYTGKAFYGMGEYLQKKQIQGKNILFIHTGGTPLFFDFLKTADPKPEVRGCCNRKKLLAFLEKIDMQLPSSLSSRVDLGEYADKVIHHGRVLTIEAADQIVSAVLFYCNDKENQNAYVTLIGTLNGYEGKGYGRLLMNEMEETAKLAGMKRISLDTERINQHAISLYCKCGYVIERADNKIHMVKEFQK